MDTLKIFSNRFSEAFIACMLTMVKGDVSAISLNHFKTASETGIVTALSGLFCWLFLSQEYKDNKYVISGLTGFLTAVVDMFVHPSHFGGASTEAIVTGIGAGSLCFVMAHIKQGK